QFLGWNAQKRLAVLAHEGAHVANRDFYVLLLASLNRVVFWFSPFSWWQQARLAELTEIISDAQAIEVIDDRLSYAEILLDVATSVRPRPMELAMARVSTVRTRVERIIAAASLPVAVGWRKRLWIAAAMVPAVIVSTGMIAYRNADAVLPIESIPDVMAAPQGKPFVNFYALQGQGQPSVFAIFREGDDLFGQLTGQRRLRLTVSGGVASYAATGGDITYSVDAERRSSELLLHQNDRDIRAIRVVEMPRTAADNLPLDQVVGWYKLNASRVLAVSRDGDRLRVQETGRPAFESAADGAGAFSAGRDDLVVFLSNEQGKVTRVLLQSATYGARLAARIDEAAAKTVEANFARRIAEVPDRFREQIPAPGGKEAILRGIEDLRRGAPNYERMSPMLANKIRRQAYELQAAFIALGKVETMFFRGVGPGGYDIYGAKFENGMAEFRMMF
ncbi:MAG: M56 family metallopeptidase, partial [Bradyrhizobium guangdongense]